MNESLRDRILKKLDTLSDERGYQVLDYVDFLESRYAERQNPQNAFTRFTDSIEGTLRAGKVSASTIAETMGFLNKATGVLNTALQAGKSMATDLYQSGSSVVQNLNTPPRLPNDAGASQQPPSAAPGSPEEKL
jgi:hypothetical protein